MKSLFIVSDSNEMIARINRLPADAKAAWGKMTVDQMLVHAQRPLKVASGELKLKRTLAGILFGGMAKKKLTSPGPWRKDLPTDKHFVVTGRYNVDEERKNLIALVRQFGTNGPEGITKDPHPFFGRMTTQEWDALTWNHLDHHLRQFGV